MTTVTIEIEHADGTKETLDNVEYVNRDEHPEHGEGIVVQLEPDSGDDPEVEFFPGATFEAMLTDQIMYGDASCDPAHAELNGTASE